MLYTLADCPSCLRRYAVAPVRPGLFGLWPVVDVQCKPLARLRGIAIVAADGPLCVTCGANLETAVQTANGSWIDLGNVRVAAFAN